MIEDNTLNQNENKEIDLNWKTNLFTNILNRTYREYTFSVAATIL